MPIILNQREYDLPSYPFKRSTESYDYISTGEYKRNVEGPTCSVGDV